MLQHVTHNYIIKFVEGLFPPESEAHCGYTSLHKYVITIPKLTFWDKSTMNHECNDLHALKWKLATKIYPLMAV